MFLLASILYYEWDLSILQDDAFDTHCHFLLSNYHKLPSWFTARVSRGDLSTGSGFAVEYRNCERLAAVAWWERVRGAIPE